MLADVSLQDFFGQVGRLQVSRIAPVIRLLLVMLLTLGLIQAHPTKPRPTLCALDLSATTTHQSDPGSTLLVRARLATVLEVDLVEFGLHKLVRLRDVVHLLLVFRLKVDPIDHATLEGMNMLPTVETEVMLAMLAPASILFG